MPDGARIGWLRQIARSIYFQITVSAILPCIFLIGILLLLNDIYMDRLSEGPTNALLCRDIQQLRSSVGLHLAKNLTGVDPGIVTSGLAAGRDGSAGAAASNPGIRWTVNVGKYRYSTLAHHSDAEYARQVAEVRGAAEGSRAVETFRRSDGAYIACTEVYNLTDRRLAGYPKGVYTVAWPLEDYARLKTDIIDNMKQSDYSTMVFWLSFLLIAMTVAVFQVIVVAHLLRSLRADIGGVLDGSASRLGGAYPREVGVVKNLFNDVIHENEAALRNTRTLITKIAHDLNNKLQAVIVATSGDTVNVELLRRNISAMKSQIDRYRQLASSSQVDSQAKWKGEEIDLIEFAKDMLWVQKFDLTNSRNRYDLLVEGAPQEEGTPHVPLMVKCYKADLEIMVSNLLSNASKYGDGIIQLNVALDGGIAVIEVGDNGPGIAPDDRERVFAPGIMLNPDQKIPGSGFGLDIVSMICVNVYGGAVGVGESTLGGALFTLRLPILKSERRRDR